MNLNKVKRFSSYQTRNFHVYTSLREQSKISENLINNNLSEQKEFFMKMLI